MNEASEVSLLALAPSAFLFHLCPYLSAFDLLNLRISSKQIHDMLHKEREDSELLWLRLLQRDFGLDAAIHKEEGWNQVLNLKFPGPRVTPIFGVDPADPAEFLLTMPSAFDVWRYWLKADLRVLPQRRSTLRGASGNTFIHAPYFLRAARFWQRLLQWCDAQPTQVGSDIRRSLGTAFDGYGQLTTRLAAVEDGVIPKMSCCMAVLAIYAFSSGQGTSFRRQSPFDGLLGGYHAYGYYSSLSLIAPTSISTMDRDAGGGPTSTQYFLKVAEDLLGQQQRINKHVFVDLVSGKLMAMWEHRICYSSSSDDPHGDKTSIEPPRQDDFLLWLEEYMRRLTSGIYRADKLGTYPSDPDAITLFPQFPTTPETPIPICHASSVPLISRAVTRGVEVVGSSVYAPQGGNRFGFIYCIRLRLLQPGEEGYQDEQERGFVTCQLQSRHWRIHNDSTDHTDHVDGDGVIGMYPLLREGGYADGSHLDRFTDGCFQYQSCTGPMGETGSFGGHIGFVPGSLRQPTGPAFMADLSPFLLDSRPTISTN